MWSVVVLAAGGVSRVEEMLCARWRWTWLHAIEWLVCLPVKSAVVAIRQERRGQRDAESVFPASKTEKYTDCLTFHLLLHFRNNLQKVRSKTLDLSYYVT